MGLVLHPTTALREADGGGDIGREGGMVSGLQGSAFASQGSLSGLGLGCVQNPVLQVRVLDLVPSALL